MAFTTSEDAQIRQTLGYPNSWRYKDPRLESQIEVVGADVDASAMVLALLVKVAAVQATIGSTSLTVAGIKKADEVEFFGGSSQAGNGQLGTVRAIGRQLCSQLSILMGVPLYGDIFGEGGYPGDQFMSAQNQYGGGVFPLG